MNDVNALQKKKCIFVNMFLVHETRDVNVSNEIFWNSVFHVACIKKMFLESDVQFKAKV